MKNNETPMKKMKTFWIGSFLIIGTSMYVYFHVPLIPILLGGAFAFALSFGYVRMKNSSKKSKGDL